MAEVETYREEGKVKQKVIKYLGKEVEGKPIRRISTAEIDKIVVKHHGQIRILKNLTEKLGFEKFVTKEILVLIYSHLIESKLSINKIEDWVKGVISLRPIRVWLKEHIISHIHICYLAFALLSLLNYKVKKLNMNGVNALEEMEGVYQVKILRKDGTLLWEGLNEVKNVQKEIFNICSV